MERFVDLLNALAKYHADIHSQQAAGRFDEAAQLSIEGKIDDAESRSADANRILDQARGVRRVWGTFIAQLTEMGINDIPLAPLSKRLGQPIIISEATTVDPTTPPETSLPPAREERQLQPPATAPEVAPVVPTPTEPVPTFFAPPEPEPVRQVVEAAQPQALAESGKIKRLDGDFGPKEEELAYALFAVNEDRTGFAHESFEATVESVYKDVLEGAVDEKDRATKLYRYMYRAEEKMLGSIEHKLKAAKRNPDRIPHYLGQFLEWVKSLPEYATTDVKEMIAVVNGEIKFEELQRGGVSAPELTAESRVESPFEVPVPVVEAPTVEVTSTMEAKVEIAPPVQVAAEPEVSLVMGAELPVEPALVEPTIASAEPELTSAVAEVEAPTPEVGEKRVKGDLTALEERIAYAFLAINREKGRFEFDKRKEIVEFLYQEQLSGFTEPSERNRKIHSLSGPLMQFAEKILSKLRLAETRMDEVPAYTAQLLKWVSEQPEYSGMSVDQLESIIFRRTTYGQLQQRVGIQSSVEIKPSSPESSNGLMPTAEFIAATPAPTPVVEVTAEQPPAESIVEIEEKVGPQLSLSEAYLLAQRLSSLDAEALTNLGIKLAPDDREEVEATIDRLSANPEASLDDPLAGMRLFKKLMAFAKDKQSIFMANEDEDVQYLLTLLAGVDSEDVIRELSGAAPDVKKKTSLARELEEESEEITYENLPASVPITSTRSNVLRKPTDVEVLKVLLEALTRYTSPEPEVLVEAPTLLLPPKPEVIVPILNHREGMQPLTVEDFKRWVERQVYMRRGDPDMVLDNGSQNAWKLFIDFDEFILFEDAHLLLMNKPPRVNSHYSPRDPAGMEEIAKHKRGANVLLAHRLDKDTTGVITLAKDMVSYWQLRNQFSNKADADVTKKYLALLDGELLPKGAKGVIEAAPTISRTETERMRIVPPDEVKDKTNGFRPQHSLTYFKPLVVIDGPEGTKRTLTEVQIITGRTHQIRVTAADFLQHPIVGDRMYNPDPSGAFRPLLHAFELTLQHPIKKEMVTFTAPLPDDFKTHLQGINLEQITPQLIKA